MNESQPTIYILGGPPRSAKTTIVRRLIEHTGVQAVATDAMEHGLRKVLTGEPHQLLRGISFSGSAEFTPVWASRLQLPGYCIRAAFVGFTGINHVEAILEHTRQTEHDWINDWLKNDGGDDSNIRSWAENQLTFCRELQLQANNYGFPFFDISQQPFDDYQDGVINYLTG